MSQESKSVGELLPSVPCDLYARGSRATDSRTSLKRYLLDPVLPMLTLLSMSVLTVVMLVTIVAAVADMDVRLPDGYVNVDPWAGVSLSPPGGSYPDPGPYANVAASPDPTEDRDPWPDPLFADRF